MSKPDKWVVTQGDWLMKTLSELEADNARLQSRIEELGAQIGILTSARYVPIDFVQLCEDNARLRELLAAIKDWVDKEGVEHDAYLTVTMPLDVWLDAEKWLQEHPS